MKLSPETRGFKLIELVFTTALVGVLGLIIYSLLNAGTILGAKNTAVNTAHQQARVAMLQMVQDLHAAVSLPYLVDANANQVSAGPAAGIAFQQYSMGPLKIIQDTAALPGSQNFVKVRLPSSTSPLPTPGQRLIIPTHQIEGDITAVNGNWNDLTITLANMPAPSPAPSPVASPARVVLPVRIQGTTPGATPNPNGDIICLITDRCWYTINATNKTLNWHRQGDRVMVNDITNPTPFNTPTTPAGALYFRFVAAIDLSTSDLNFTNRGFKSANILLNGQVPMRTRLTTYQ